MSKRRSILRSTEDMFYRMLDGGLFVGETADEDYEDEPEPTKASKVVYTWLAIYLKNYRDSEVTVQDGGRIRRQAVIETESEIEIIRDLMEQLELRFIGKPIDDEKAKVKPVFDD